MELLSAGVLAALLAGGVYYYNRLVRERNRVDTAWSDIDVQLQRRHDLVPRLVEAVRQYAAYEQASLEAIAELRARALARPAIDELGEIEEALARTVVRLLALAEQYPDLKASENFLELQKELAGTENYLQFARRYYNASVRDYNTSIDAVPSNVVARIFGFSPRPFFQKSSDEAAGVPLARFGSVE